MTSTGFTFKAFATASSSPGEEMTVRVALLRCKSSGRVLFLEAGKEFVDILVSFLMLPAGTIIRLLSEGANVKNMGGISSIFENVQNLEDSLLYVDKLTLTDPKPAMDFRRPGLLQLESGNRDTNPDSNSPHVYYRCAGGCGSISTSCNARCPKAQCSPYDYTFCSAGALSVVEIPQSKPHVDQKSTVSKAGYVKKNLTYIVTDNLEITPNSTIKSINILSTMKVEKMSDLESTDISVSSSQVLQLLQAALTSNSALNDVFGKK